MTLERLNNLGGLWAFLSLLVQASAVFVGLKLLRSRRKTLPNLNFTLAVVDGGHPGDVVTADRRLAILIRNLSGIDIVVGSAYASIADREVVSEYADGDNASGEYELKFRGVSSAFTEGFTLVKSTEAVETYLPLTEQPDVDGRKIIARLTSVQSRPSFLNCKVIALTKNPVVHNFRIPLRNLQHRPKGIYNKPAASSFGPNGEGDPPVRI